MKNVFEGREVKLQNEWYFEENKTGYTACLKNSVNFLVAYMYKMNF
jgi:hypothetical protein